MSVGSMGGLSRHSAAAMACSDACFDAKSIPSYPLQGTLESMCEYQYVYMSEEERMTSVYELAPVHEIEKLPTDCSACEGEAESKRIACPNKSVMPDASIGPSRGYVVKEVVGLYDISARG